MRYFVNYGAKGPRIESAWRHKTNYQRQFKIYSRFSIPSLTNLSQFSQSKEAETRTMQFIFILTQTFFTSSSPICFLLFASSIAMPIVMRLLSGQVKLFTLILSSISPDLRSHWLTVTQINNFPSLQLQWGSKYRPFKIQSNS